MTAIGLPDRAKNCKSDGHKNKYLFIKKKHSKSLTLAFGYWLKVGNFGNLSRQSELKMQIGHHQLKRSAKNVRY